MFVSSEKLIFMFESSESLGDDFLTLARNIISNALESEIVFHFVFTLTMFSILLILIIKLLEEVQAEKKVKNETKRFNSTKSKGNRRFNNKRFYKLKRTIKCKGFSKRVYNKNNGSVTTVFYMKKQPEKDLTESIEIKNNKVMVISL